MAKCQKGSRWVRKWEAVEGSDAALRIGSAGCAAEIRNACPSATCGACGLLAHFIGHVKSSPATVSDAEQ